MKRLMGLTLTVALLSLVTWARADDKDKVAEEDKKFDGTWQVVAMELGGNKAQNEAYETMTFTFKGKSMSKKEAMIW